MNKFKSRNYRFGVFILLFSLSIGRVAQSESFAVNDSAPGAGTPVSGGDTAAIAPEQSASPEPAVPAAEAQPGQRPISIKSFVPNFLSDQKLIFLYPFHLSEGKHFKHIGAALGFAAITAGLIALDPHDTPYFRNNTGFNTYKTGILRGRNTTLLVVGVPVAAFLGGLAKHDSYTVGTGLLAAEALADTQLIGTVLKAATGRLAPSQIAPHGDFTHTWFKYQGTWNNPGSFPSGHTSAAFSVATVFASRYRDHKWVPWVAYGVATLIGLSRLPDQAHFPSDLFAGAALGYTMTRFVVLRQ